MENKLKLKVNENKSSVTRPVEVQAPRVQRDMAQTSEDENSPGEREPFEGENLQSDYGKPEQISESDRQCPDASVARMDKLLQTDGGQRNAGETGWLDQTETAVPVAAALEETTNLERAGLSKDSAIFSE